MAKRMKLSEFVADIATTLRVILKDQRDAYAARAAKQGVDIETYAAETIAQYMEDHGIARFIDPRDNPRRN